MQLHRNLGFQQNQCYGLETQQERYEVHEEAWSSRNDHHNNNHHIPGMHMTNGTFGQGHHQGSSSGHQGHGHFSGGGGGHNHSFGGSHHRGHGGDYFSEMNELRYERQNWGNGNGFCPNNNPYDRNMNNNRFHKVEWEVKGV